MRNQKGQGATEYLLLLVVVVVVVLVFRQQTLESVEEYRKRTNWQALDPEYLRPQ